MSCCGMKREAMQQRPRAALTQSAKPSVPERPRAAVIFQGRGAYLVEGPYTLEIYHFPAGQEALLVDTRDAAAMIETGLFRSKA